MAFKTGGKGVKEWVINERKIGKEGKGLRRKRLTFLRLYKRSQLLIRGSKSVENLGEGDCKYKTPVSTMCKCLGCASVLSCLPRMHTMLSVPAM